VISRLLVATTAAVLCSVASGAASAQEQLVVATFGGSFADNTRTCVVEPFEKATGAKVVLRLGNSVQHAASLRAGRGRTGIDIAYVDDSLATQLNNESLLDSVDVTKLTHREEVIPEAFGPDNRYVTFMLGATAIAYNPQVITTPPTSWADVFDKRYAGRMALGDITGTSGLHFLLAVNRMRGGTLENIDAGFAALKAAIPNSVVLYTQADQVISLFQRGEVVIAPWYPDRAGAARDAGVPIAIAYPKEGAVGIRPTVVVPKGAPNAALATRYIDTMLSPEVQLCFAAKAYAGPVNTRVSLPERIASVVPTGDNLRHLWFPDPQEVAKGIPAWHQRWQRETTR
jgi:putative spermidine/putrescine transport system substrate-binding protein